MLLGCGNGEAKEQRGRGCLYPQLSLGAIPWVVVGSCSSRQVLQGSHCSVHFAQEHSKAKGRVRRGDETAVSNFCAACFAAQS